MPIPAAIQAYLEAGRLPITFSAFAWEQMREWELLFPAEQRHYERLFGLLARSDPREVDRLFAPMREIESQMGVNGKTWPQRRFTLDQVDFLNRNPRYPEWRAAVTGVFAQLDPLLDAEVARQGRARLVIVISPPEIPAGPDRMWLRVAGHGQRLAVEPAEDFLAVLLTGAPRERRAPSIADLCSKGKYDSWIIEAGNGASSLGTGTPGPVRCSYELLERYRKRLMADVQHVVQSEEIRGPRQLGTRLKQMKALASEGEMAHDAILAEFARTVLLSGNGTLLVNNTFVEWAATQAARRARPSAAVVSFGVRNKIKPFTSLLIYTDPEVSNPIPSQMDTLGTYVDLEIFYQYLWQEFEKYAEYRKNTAYLFVGDGMDQMLAIAPPDFPLLAAKEPLKLSAIFQALKDWMNA